MIDKIKWAREVLELPPLSNYYDLKKQYKKLSKKYHPDISKDDKMAQLNEAYEIMKEYMLNYRFRFDEDEIKSQYHNILEKFRI